LIPDKKQSKWQNNKNRLLKIKSSKNLNRKSKEEGEMQSNLKT
jgi:hypothetical protein